MAEVSLFFLDGVCVCTPDFSNLYRGFAISLILWYTKSAFS